jgi:large conductance mechanosensitive channel
MLSRRDPLALVVVVAIGIGAYYAVQAIVQAMLVPVISVFVGAQRFNENAFTINGVEFLYGYAIEYALPFVAILGLGYVVLAASEGKGAADEAGPRRHCPECTMSIPGEARRCPFCTAHVAPDGGPTA